MRNPHLLLWVVCAALAAGSSSAMAGSIIDESFAADPGILEAMQPSLEVASFSADTWWQLPENNGIQWGVSGGMVFANGGMAMAGEYSTLCYFGAKPTIGWGGDTVTLSFDFLNENGTASTFGVYGWNTTDLIPFGADPGANGVPLITGVIPLSTVLTLQRGSQTAALGGFDFIGLAVTTQNGAAPTLDLLTLDNVQLNVTPEPASMALMLAGLGALVFKRRKRPIG